MRSKARQQENKVPRIILDKETPKCYTKLETQRRIRLNQKINLALEK